MSRLRHGYNPIGTRKLPFYYYDRVLLPNGVPPTNNSFGMDLKTPMSVQGNVAIDRQLTNRLAASGSFLWSRGYNNVRNFNLNPQAPIFVAGSSLAPNGVITPFDIQYRGGARPDPRFTEDWHYINVGKMAFKGVSTSLTSRWTNLQARVSYTWNDAWDDSVAISFKQGPSNPDCVACEWSRSVLNVSRLVGSLVYSTPQSWGIFGRDWQASTIFEYEAGHPFQVISGFDFNNDTIPADRPLGVPRNSLVTESFRNVDVRVARMLPIRGDVKVELMFEMFNILNTANYSGYVDSLYVLQSGRYVPRPDFTSFQNSADLNTLDTHRPPDEIGLKPPTRRSSVADPFQGQFGFRLRF